MFTLRPAFSFLRAFHFALIAGEMIVAAVPTPISFAHESNSKADRGDCGFVLTSHPVFRNRRMENWTSLAQSGQWKDLALEVESVIEILEQVESGDYARVYGLPLLTKALKKRWISDPELISRAYREIAHHLPFLRGEVSAASEIWFQELVHRAFGHREIRALTQAERLKESGVLLSAALEYWKNREEIGSGYKREKRTHFRKQSSLLKAKVEMEWRNATPQLAWAAQKGSEDSDNAVLARNFLDLALQLGQNILGKDQKQMEQWLKSFKAAIEEI